MLKSLTTSIGRFRLIAFTEGVSYLILLFIAMPLKYIWHDSSAVRTFGSIHGALFVLYILYLAICHFEYNWQLKKSAMLFLLSVIPFGNFYADKYYLKNLD